MYCMTKKRLEFPQKNEIGMGRFTLAACITQFPLKIQAGNDKLYMQTSLVTCFICSRVARGFRISLW